MNFKKVQITKENSTEITVLENVNVWFTSAGGHDLFLYIGDCNYECKSRL